MESPGQDRESGAKKPVRSHFLPPEHVSSRKLIKLSGALSLSWKLGREIPFLPDLSHKQEIRNEPAVVQEISTPEKKRTNTVSFKEENRGPVVSRSDSQPGRRMPSVRLGKKTELCFFKLLPVQKLLSLSI